MVIVIETTRNLNHRCLLQAIQMAFPIDCVEVELILFNAILKVTVVLETRQSPCMRAVL